MIGLEKIFDPAILTFIGVTFIPVILIWRRERLSKIDRGFVLLIIGTSIISMATFVDYFYTVFQDTIFSNPILIWLGENRKWVTPSFMYLPGTLISGFGLGSWLPALQRLDREIDRRIETEEELRNLAKELERLAVKAEEANHAKSSFLASMSHELRTPLNAILGFSEVIKNEYFGPLQNEKYKDYGDAIHSSGGHLLSVISDILDIAKIESGKLELFDEKFSVNNGMSDCLLIMGGMIKEKNIKFTLHKLPEDKIIYADKRVFKQVIINLLSNACKFTDPGDSISLAANMDESELKITVSDSGIGIDPADLNHIMTPFVQIENVHTRQRGGTGLGLSIVKEMVELHEGRIEMSSQAGVGTTVCIYFPATRIIN